VIEASITCTIATLIQAGTTTLGPAARAAARLGRGARKCSMDTNFRLPPRWGRAPDRGSIALRGGRG
jgi:hypothetical protein